MNYVKGIRLDVMPNESSYLCGLPMIKYLGCCEALAFDKPVTFFVGENGTGKSTLLEAIAVGAGFNAEGGSRDHMFATKDTTSELAELITVLKTVAPDDGFFLRAESFYNTASYLDENSTMRRYGGVLLHEQSHGESFFSLIENRFEGNGLYILDEPEAALSPMRLMALLPIIDGLVRKNSQFIIATHSPILLAYPNAEILQFSGLGIEKVDYCETEHYKITKMFMDDPERMVYHLLNDEKAE